MKKIFLSVILMGVLLFVGCKNEKNETETTDSLETSEVSEDIALAHITFGVRGNCGMCKSTIEKAAQGVEGVDKAVWDVDRKKIDVYYDHSTADVMAIHKAIAASGYDTEQLAGDEEAYGNLPQCCQYDHDMAMNQEVLEGDEGNHHTGEDPHMED